MNRITYWVKAHTQYSVHSPFVFDMYRKVLFARLPYHLSQKVAQDKGGCKKYHEMVYKLKEHYGMDTICYDEDEAVLKGGADSMETVKVVCRPHSCRQREWRWQAQQGNDKYNVSIDLYDVGLLISHPKLHRQHFLLK